MPWAVLLNHQMAIAVLPYAQRYDLVYVLICVEFQQIGVVVHASRDNHYCLGVDLYNLVVPILVLQTGHRLLIAKHQRESARIQADIDPQRLSLGCQCFDGRCAMAAFIKWLRAAIESQRYFVLGKQPIGTITLLQAHGVEKLGIHHVVTGSAFRKALHSGVCRAEVGKTSAAFCEVRVAAQEAVLLQHDDPGFWGELLRQHGCHEATHARTNYHHIGVFGAIGLKRDADAIRIRVSRCDSAASIPAVRLPFRNDLRDISIRFFSVFCLSIL